ncbi:hypothetical protein AQJ46_39745 [Streptomyces canus]|uniref:Uncharacterized protein n=1 Tax=Streptomyces canus TaxID=58343 RepID=A0A101RPE8_9ACTN|nr:hypothetical protein AQJ46_39745 [Streptomyces canus]
MLIDIHGRVAIDLRVSLTDVGEQPAPHVPHAGRGPAVAGQARSPLLPRLRPHSAHRRRQACTCLFARDESDLRGALRSGVPDEDIAGLEARDAGKRAGSGLDEPSILQPGRPMSAGGG